MNVEKVEINEFVYKKTCLFIKESIYKLKCSGFSEDRLKVLIPNWFKIALTHINPMQSYDNNLICGLEIKDNYQDKIVVYVDNYRPMHPAFTEIDIHYLINE